MHLPAHESMNKTAQLIEHQLIPKHITAKFYRLLKKLCDSHMEGSVHSLHSTAFQFGRESLKNKAGTLIYHFVSKDPFQ